MITKILAKLFGTANLRALKKLQPIVDKINQLEESMIALDDQQLSAKTIEFQQRIAQGETLDDILPEAFAVVREASKRTLGMRHFDVQLIGGMVLHQGKIAEMRTGEGKTLTATLPLYLNALSGKGAHLVTVNDYLARRDATNLRPLYEMLGMTVGILQNNMDDQERKDAYGCDIMYATNNELGFDYLRDNMKFRLEDYVQRDLNFAIVDEVDSILIDEARTPLIISGSSDESSQMYMKVQQVVKKLQKDTHYEVNEKDRNVTLTEAGVDKLEHEFGVENMYAVENIALLHHVTQALKANALFRRDVDYVVKDDEVLIVDEFTGRILPGRRYSDGLHQALEAKEGVKVERESQTLASITLQNFFRLYSKLAGMTGTAATEAEEFERIYKLGVVVVPTNKPMIRQDQQDLIFLNKNAKYKAIAEDVKERHAKGQPVLIGTVAIETSELLSDVLRMSGIPHNVLNAKQHEREAEIVADAGRAGAVTIATNMAGRGTDIKPSEDALLAGGLYVLGTERHESRRIDNQLRGRSGRQGDSGESRFYISLEDDLIRIFGGEQLKKTMERFGMKEDEVIESNMVTKRIENAQERVEKHNFEIRRHLLEYDDVLNQQRMVIYAYRRSVLEGSENIYALVRDLIAAVVEDVIVEFCPQRAVSAEQAKELFHYVSSGVGIDLAEFEQAGINTKNSEQLTKDLINFLLQKYSLMRTSENLDRIQSAEKWLILEAIDQAWKQHMLNLDHLKEGIGLRGWGQKTPLIEYKREAFQMFQDMMRQVKQEIIAHIFRLNVERFDEHALEEKRERELEELNMNITGEAEQAQRDADRVGRNEPCPCGSGKKNKKCCNK